MTQPDDDKRLLEQALWLFYSKNEFNGFLLQEMSVRISNSIETACLKYDKNHNEFQVLINSNFLKKLSIQERVAIIEHEMLHFTTKHIFRFNRLDVNGNPVLHNIAMDISINQYIKNLPKGAVYPEQFTDEHKNPFPKRASYEEYFKLLAKTMPKSKGGNRDDKSAQMSPHPNEDTLKKYGLVDEHDFEQLTEAETRRMLQEGARVITRSIEKISHSQSKIDKQEEYKELLEFINNKLRKMNTKALFKQAIRKTVTRSERESSRFRPNKRFGYISPGTRLASVPFVDSYCDTSGSMSQVELGRFMSALFKLCGTAAPNCTLALWHTALYHTMKFNKRTQFADIPWQSGGTDATDVAKKVNEKDSDLTIIMTDGYYTTDVAFKKNNVVWLISDKNGLNHPCKHIGKTFLLEDIINE